MPTCRAVRPIPTPPQLLCYLCHAQHRDRVNAKLPLGKKHDRPGISHSRFPSLLGLALTPRESLKATTIWSGLSGLAVVNVSDWVMLGEASVPVIRSTSVLPYTRGAVRLRTSLEKALAVPPSSGSPPPFASPQKIVIAPARRFSILSIPNW